MRTSRMTLALCGAAAVLLGAGACGGGSKDATGTTPQSYGDAQKGPQSGSQGDGPPGASGTVAAVDGSTAQVQNPMSGQVAVSWTSATTFTKQVAAARTDVKTGVCVVVEPTRSTGSAGSGAEDTTPPTEVAAAAVRITAKTNGTCAPAIRAGAPQLQRNGDGGPQVQGEGPPPDDATPGRTQLRGFGAFGEVTGVTADGFTVSSAQPAGNGSETEATTITVTVTAATTYTTMAKGTASDVKVGVCVRADGTVDGTGAVTAKTIAVTPPQDGQCGAMTFRRDGAPGSSSGPGSDSGSSSGATRVS